MKKLLATILILLVLGSAGTLGWFLFIADKEMQKENDDIPGQMLQDIRPEETNSSTDDSFNTSAPVENDTQDLIPQDLYDQLDVTDLEVQELSIANEPDLWRAFLNSGAPMSDPFFEFGCLEYLDTGSQIVVNLFIDEAEQAWVSESVEDVLIGVGKLSFVDYDRITAYRTQDVDIACLELLKRQYDDYFLLSEDIKMQLYAQAGDINPQGYDIVILVNNVYLPLPFDVIAQVDSYTGALREPVLVANRFLLGYGDFGVYAFDLKTWERSSLFGLGWDDLRGVTSIRTIEDEPIVVFAYQSWDEMPQAMVLVYDLSEGLNDYTQYTRYASLAWTMGSNEIFALESPTDLELLSTDTVRIIEYPNFSEDVTNGDDPYEGKTEITTWKFTTNTLIK